jgi:hypothetical protein
MTANQLNALEKLVALNTKKLELFALIAWFEDTKQSPHIVTPLGNPPVLLKAIVKEIELHIAAVRGAFQ